MNAMDIDVILPQKHYHKVFGIACVTDAVDEWNILAEIF